MICCSSSTDEGHSAMAGNTMETVEHIFVTSCMCWSSFVFSTSLCQIWCTVRYGAVPHGRDHVIQQFLNHKKTQHFGCSRTPKPLPCNEAGCVGGHLVNVSSTFMNYLHTLRLVCKFVCPVGRYDARKSEMNERATLFLCAVTL